MALYKVQEGRSTPPDAVGCVVKIDREYPGSSYVHVKDIHSKRGWYVFRADLAPWSIPQWGPPMWPRTWDFPWLFTEEVLRIKDVDSFCADTVFKTKPFIPADQVVFIGGPSHGRVERHDNRPTLCAYSLLRDRALFAMDFAAKALPDVAATGIIHTYHCTKDGRAVHESVTRLYPADVQAGYHFE